jgi:hypothetical protein
MQLHWPCLSAAASCLALLLSVVGTIEGAPILGPDLNTCTPIIPQGKTAEEAVSCCLEECRAIVDFEYPDPTKQPMRIRQGIHKVNDEFWTKYDRAMTLMKALPEHDPRSWHAQSNIHCIYGAGAAYQQFNSSPPQIFEVHFNWFVLPFHRMFVYFHERILGSLIGDPSFAVPYWAWDIQNETNPLANGILDMYSNRSSNFFDEQRAQNHLPPNPADLNFQRGGVLNPNIEEVVLGNYYMMWRTMIGETTTQKAFFGGKVSLGENISRIEGAGIPEMGPHGGVHLWTGEEGDGYDMGVSYTGAKDPIFFAHHSEVDRLWYIRNKHGGKDIEDPDWLDTEFLLYDENANMVRVTVRQSLDTDRLRYEFEDIPLDWMDFTPQSIRDPSHPYYPKYSSRLRSIGLHRLWRSFLNRGVGAMVRNMFSVLSRRRLASDGLVAAMPVRAPITTRVSRCQECHQLLTESSDEKYDEVLVFRGVVTKPFNAEVRFHIFLDLPEADESTTLSCLESMGSFYVEPEGKKGKEDIVTREFSHLIGIGPDRLRLLDLHDASYLTFTFVPAWNAKHDAHVSIKFMEVKVESLKANHFDG